jgi:hypothetical protein
MNDNFQQDIEKLKRLEKILREDLKKRDDICNKNGATLMVIII